MKRFATIGLMVMGVASLLSPAPARALDADAAERFAALALQCVHREYPNKIAHVMQSDADINPPRKLTPAFYGCFDWHSSVHAHWLLARLARGVPDAGVAAEAKAALTISWSSSGVRSAFSRSSHTLPLKLLAKLRLLISI